MSGSAAVPLSDSLLVDQKSIGTNQTTTTTLISTLSLKTPSMQSEYTVMLDENETKIDDEIMENYPFSSSKPKEKRKKSKLHSLANDLRKFRSFHTILNNNSSPKLNRSKTFAKERYPNNATLISSPSNIGIYPKFISFNEMTEISDEKKTNPNIIRSLSLPTISSTIEYNAYTSNNTNKNINHPLINIQEWDTDDDKLNTSNISFIDKKKEKQIRSRLNSTSTEWSLMPNDSEYDAPFTNIVSKKRLLPDFNTVWKRVYLALAIIAIITGFLSFVISKATSQAWTLQLWIYNSSTLYSYHWAIAYVFEVSIKLVLVLSSIAITQRFAPESAGSGVPELRAILSGIWIRYYLSFTTFCTKTVALTLALSAGIPIGLEGPFIHLSSIVGRQLISRLRFFSHLDRKQILSAACAGGIASAFGAPIGGVLFSIEVTSTYYPTTNYWSAFCCAIVGSTVTQLFQNLSPTDLLLYQTNFSTADKPTEMEYTLIALLAIVCGFIGVAFIFAHQGYVYLRVKHQARYLGNNPYGIAIVVILFFTTVTFFIGDFAINPARKAVSDMFNVSDLGNCDESYAPSDESCSYIIGEEDSYDCTNLENDEYCQKLDYCNCNYHDWNINFGLLSNITLFCVINFFYTIAVITLAIPCGIFAPVFTLGSVFGRLSGELFSLDLFPVLGADQPDPRTYSVIGAAALASAVTQTISPAVIALEITGDLTLVVPILFAVIISGGISSSLTHSFYDSILQLRGIPMLPIRPTIPYKKVKVRRPSISESPRSDTGFSYRLIIADDVMQSDFLFVTIDPTPKDCVRVLQDSNVEQEWFPIVHSMSELVLVGEVRRSVLMDYLKCIAPDMYLYSISDELRSNHVSFLGQNWRQIIDKASLMNDTTLLSERDRVVNAPQNQSLLQRWINKKVKKVGNIEMDQYSMDTNIDNEITDEDKEQTVVKVAKLTLMSAGFIERINLSPMQVISEMALTKIYTLFHILKPQNVYVTKYSRLIGIINELQLLEREFQHRETTAKVKYLFRWCQKIVRKCKK